LGGWLGVVLMLSVNLYRVWLLSNVSDRAFPVSAAYVWNRLPAHVTSSPSLHVFQRLYTFFNVWTLSRTFEENDLSRCV